MRPICSMFVVGLLIAVNLATGRAAGTTVTSFSITGDATYWGVLSNGVNSYEDYRIDSTTDQLNACVQAEPNNTGFLFIRFNRKLDGDTGVQYCDRYSPSLARQYSLQIVDTTICALLSEDGAGLLAEGALTVAGDGSCTLVRSDNPRIRLSTLYKPRAKATPVAFLITMFDYPVSWEIRTVDDAPITTRLGGNPAVRSVKYTGKVELYRFAPNVKTRVVGPAFDLPLEMVFTEWPL